MEGIGPYLILFGNCCLMPLLFAWLGYAYARGWIRSPIAINRRPQIDPEVDPFDDP